MLVEATVAVSNGSGLPLSGDLTWGRVPEGWDVTARAARIENLPPGKRRVTRLTARTSGVAATAEGIFPIRVAFRTPDRDPIATVGRLCVLTAPPRARELTIDGKLDDWSLATNVASDFVLVGALGVPVEELPGRGRASQLTTVFMAHDDAHLYVAFNCRDDDMGSRRIAASNYVRYDDLWPRGEDLVEVILDPTGGTGGVGDLYHILVKSNGTVVAERGFACLEQVAPYAPWPAAVTAAVDDRSRPDQWTVELRISRESLGTLAPIIGINFARMDARRGEYSSWAPASSHLYTPTALGNLILAK
jgi:hypothetical protein